MNVSSMDMTGGLSVKDPSQSQSRLPQWTHPNPMDNLPGAASPLDQNPSKHGMSKLRSPRVWSLLFCLLIIPISLRVCVSVCTRARAHTHAPAQSDPALCNPIDCRPQGSSVRGISQARVLEWVATSSFRGSSRPWGQTHVSRVPCVGRWIPYHCATWEALCYLHGISVLRIQY